MSSRRSVWVAIVGVVAFAGCRSTPPSVDGSGGSGAQAGSGAAGGAVPGGGGVASAGGASSAVGGALPEPAPKYYPVPGFESCEHADVKADCTNGWCKLPPSCFVMGSAEEEWLRGRDNENRTAVTLTHWIEVQQKEFTRGQWELLTGRSPRGPESCTLTDCPISMVSWWDAVHAANLWSEERGFQPCYQPVGCTGSLGQDLTCTGVADPEKSVYECDGYRLPTRAEVEYAARAGTTSTFYSGDITQYEDSVSCLIDPALEKIAWYCFNSGDRAHVGGELQANGFGLYDIIGNLGEWSNEWQHGDSSPGGMDPRGQVGTSEQRLRFSPQYDGKSWVMRTAALLSFPWNDRGSRIGFRLVRTLPD